MDVQRYGGRRLISATAGSFNYVATAGGAPHATEEMLGCIRIYYTI